LVDKTWNNYNEKLLAIKEVLPTNYDYYLNTTLDERHYKILLHIFNKILEFDILDKHQSKYINVLINRTLSKRNKEKKDNILLY
jgi:methionyl-tRNA synthetase